MVEEPAPFVVDDEERAAAVVGRPDERVDHVRHERLPEAHVTQRMLVRRNAVAAAAVAERRVDERDVRQRAGCALAVEALDRIGPARPALPPDRRERKVGRVVAGREPVLEGAVEDRLPLVARGAHRRVVVDDPARLG
jgi:hypothetical protein